MTGRFPKTRVTLDIEGEAIVVLREGVNISFYMDGPHADLAPMLVRALGAYRRAIEPRALGWYVDPRGDWCSLAEEEEAFLSMELMRLVAGRIEASEQPDSVTGVRFRYRGRGGPEDLFFQLTPQSTFAVEFWLPIELLEQQGPARVRALAVELGQGLPFHSGYAGLSFQTWGWMDATTSLMREKSLRHPGFDLPGMDSLSMSLGTKVRAPAWLTFLGPPVLNELGGAEGLRSRLHSPGTEVHSLSTDRAVVSLGPEPEAGDLEAGDTLPHYRELARVLEPWRYVHKGSWGSLTEEEIRHWERRFL